MGNPQPTYLSYCFTLVAECRGRRARLSIKAKALLQKRIVVIRVSSKFSYGLSIKIIKAVGRVTRMLALIAFPAQK